MTAGPPVRLERRVGPEPFVERGRRVLRAANPGWPDMEVARANETTILAVMVFVGQAM